MRERADRSGVVTRRYRQPYPDPIRVLAGERVRPDFEKATDIPGWIWCTDHRERSGWVPLAWLERSGGDWRATCEFSAIELTVDVGTTVLIHAEAAGFYWLTSPDGRTGWVPCGHVRVEQ